MSLLEGSRLPPLGYQEPLTLLQTKPYDYSQAFKQGSAAAALAAAVRPDFFAELSFHRGAISTWLTAQTLVVPEPVADALAALAARLHGLMDVVGVGAAPPAAAAAASAAPKEPGKVEPPPAAEAAAAAFASAATAGWVRSEWTSAISSKPQRPLRLDSLPQELAMVYTAYAAALRHVAHQRLTEAAAAAAAGFGAAAVPAGADGGGPAEAASAGSAGSAANPLQAALTAAVGALRRVAGVYSYLAEVLLPPLAATPGTPGDRPLELLPSAARAMQQLCLAEAQALMAAAAAAKGMSPGAQRALHAGCATLFRQAQDSATELAAAAPPGLPLADRLLRLLAVSAAVHSARAHLCLALDRQAALELGEAEAGCEECSKLLEGALRRLDRSDPPGWAESIKAQQAACAALFAAVHKDRLSVTYQALPKQPPDATANAAVRVAVEAFRPASVVPPRPPAADANKGGCCIM